MNKSAKCITVILLLLLSVGAKPWTLRQQTLSNHECFVSITAREMLQSHNWVIPTCNGKLRLEKTPLSYWLVAGLAEITGRVDEITARLPSVVFGALSVIAIVYFVNLWFSFRIAALSAGVWATSLGYIRYSNNARPEMALAFFVMLCFLSFYSAINAESRRRQVVFMLIFWLSLSLGMLAKGPAPLPYVFIPLFCYVAIFKKWTVIPKLLPVIGTLVFLAIVLPWPLLIAKKMNWDLTIWKREFVDRLFGEYRPGNKPNYYYLYIMFQFIIPWVAFLPMALAAPFFKVWDKKRPVMFFLWLWFIADLIFITIDRGKRQHYILPLMPAMAILIGLLLEDMAFSRQAYTLKSAVGVLRNHIVVIVVSIIAGTIYMAETNRGMLTDVIILGAIALVSISAVGVLFAMKKQAVAYGTIFAGVLILVIVSYARIFNPMESERCSRDFSRQLAAIVPESDRLVAYEDVSCRFVQYFGRVVPVVENEPNLIDSYQNGDWIVATGSSLQKLEKNENFVQSYYEPKAERDGQEEVPGALFRKPDSVSQKQTVAQ